MRLTPIASALIISFFSVAATCAEVLVDKVAASVNNEIVLLSEVKKMPARLNKAGGVDETLLLGETPASLKNDPKKQLEFLIREKLVTSEAKRIGVSPTDEQVENEFKQMMRKNRMTATEFSAYLARQGYTTEQYKQVLRDRIERQAFFEKELISKLRITDDDAFTLFKNKSPNYKPTTAEYKISQIFFANSNGGAAEAKTRAEAALKRLNAGESFEKLAAQVDETPGAEAGGYLGEFKTGELSGDLEAAVSTLGNNQVSSIVRGSNGYHILKVLNKKTIQDPNFVKYKENIKAALIQENFERQLKNWFEQKKLDSNIKIYNE